MGRGYSDDLKHGGGALLQQNVTRLENTPR
jgi:hypothetical protein